MEEVVEDGAERTRARPSRADSSTQNGIPDRTTKSPSQTRLAAMADEPAKADIIGRDRIAHASTNTFNINLSSENDRSALTRYTHQTLTSLAAYRDALIDENGRLNAMLEKTKRGLEVLAGKSGVESGHDGGPRRDRDSSRERSTSLANIVKASMMEELKQLRGRMERLREEERIQPALRAGKSDAELQQRGSSASEVSMADSTMMIYYSIVNKLQMDLETSARARDEAKTELASICRQKSAQPANRSRPADGAGSRGRWPRNAKPAETREQITVKEIMRDALRAAGVDVTEGGAVLSLLTDQEEAVWLKERKEREMEKALRDMRCYVEAMIREWREVSVPVKHGRIGLLT